MSLSNTPSTSNIFRPSEEHLRKKRCEYSKKYYYKIKNTRPPKTEEKQAREKEYHKNYYEKRKEKRVVENREV